MNSSDRIKLRIENISVSYEGSRIIDSFSLDVKDGEFIALLGPSGCGKSTLLNMLSGVITPESGAFYVDGSPLGSSKNNFAYMPQDDMLLPWMNILDNVTLYGRINGSLEEARRQALEEFEHFGLKGYENAYPHQLSGGMRQRAAFLRTALCHADILLLDEPFGALDVITRNNMQDWLLSLHRDYHRTNILVTHDIEEALYLADRICVLSAIGARILDEIDLTGVNKTRDWLFAAGDLKKRIYLAL